MERKSNWGKRLSVYVLITGSSLLSLPGLNKSQAAVPPKQPIQVVQKDVMPPLEKTVSQATLEGYLNYSDGFDAFDFNATVVDSATGERIQMDVQGNKFYKEGLNTPVEDNKDPVYPTTFELSAPYPNPTVNDFNIQVGLAKQSNVTVGVYDILGRQVDSKNYGPRTPGHHEIFANGIDLPSGVYIIRAMVDGKALTEKATIIKGNGAAGVIGSYNVQGQVLGDISVFDSVIPDLQPSTTQTEYQAQKASGNGVTYFVQLRSNQNPKEFEDQDIRVHLVNDTTIYATAKEPINFADTITAKEDSGLVVSIDSLVQGNYGLQSVDITSGSSVMYTDRQGNNLVISTDKDVNSTDYGLLELNVTAVAPHGTPASGTVYVDVKEMTDFLAHVVDNQSLEILQNGKVMINGKEYSANNGLIELQVDPSVADSIDVAAWGVSPDTVNTFETTYRKAPMTEDWGLPAGLMVTTYNGLTNAPPDKAVHPELFREWVQEANAGYIGFPAHGLRSIDWQNASKPLEEGGTLIWIDKDAYNTLNSDRYGTFSNQEQNRMKNLALDEVLAYTNDSAHIPQIYLAQPGETPPLETDPVTQQQRLASGTIIVTHIYGSSGFQFRKTDYNNDGIIDQVFITVGDPTTFDAKTIQELASTIVHTGSLNYDMNKKTVNSEIDPASKMTPADKKLFAMEQNINNDTEWATYELPDGTQVMRGYYRPLAPLNDVANIRQN